MHFAVSCNHITFHWLITWSHDVVSHDLLGASFLVTANMWLDAIGQYATLAETPTMALLPCSMWACDAHQRKCKSSLILDAIRI